MSGLHRHGMSLSREQLKRLIRGEGIRVAHNHLRGKHHLLLTTMQAKRVMKAHREKKGVGIRMSHAQIMQHKRHGGNIISDIVEGVKRIGSKVLPSIVGVGKRLGKKALKKLKSVTGSGVKHRKRGGNLLGDIWGGIKNIGKSTLPVVGPALASFALKKAFGAGVKKRKRKHKARGITAPGY